MTFRKGFGEDSNPAPPSSSLWQMGHLLNPGAIEGPQLIFLELVPINQLFIVDLFNLLELLKQICSYRLKQLSQ